MSHRTLSLFSAPPIVADVISATAEELGNVTRLDITSRDKYPAFVRARSVAMWVLHRRCGFSSTETGRFFAGYSKRGGKLKATPWGKDHTSVLAAVRRVDRDSEMRAAAMAVARRVA